MNSEKKHDKAWESIALNEPDNIATRQAFRHVSPWKTQEVDWCHMFTKKPVSVWCKMQRIVWEMVGEEFTSGWLMTEIWQTKP